MSAELDNKSKALCCELGPYVLVHGMYHGGWCWKRVQEPLLAAGARVYSPTQTGLGERRHLLSPAITMETFVLDIVNLIEFENLEHVVLVGHSFGVRTVVGVADRIPDRLSHLVAMDGAIDIDGRPRIDLLLPEARKKRLAAAEIHDGGVSVPPPSPTAYGLTDPADIEWVASRLTPQPLGPDKSAMPLDNPVGNGLPLTYVRFTEPALTRLDSSAAYVKARPDWAYREIECCHEGVITAGPEIAALLLEIGPQTRPTSAMHPEELRVWGTAAEAPRGSDAILAWGTRRVDRALQLRPGRWWARHPLSPR